MVSAFKLVSMLGPWALVLFAPTSAAPSQAECYMPDGQIGKDYSYAPCGNSTTGYSTCCVWSGDEHDQCVPGVNLCWFPPGTSGYGGYLFRATCTDKSWKDPSCARVCTTNTPNRYETVSYCSKTDDFCCPKSAEHGDCCDDYSLRFPLPEVPASIRQALKAEASSNGTVGIAGGLGSTPSGDTLAKAYWTTGRVAGLSVGTVLAVASVGFLTFLCIRHRWYTVFATVFSRRRSLAEEHLTTPSDNEGHEHSTLERAPTQITNGACDSGPSRILGQQEMTETQIHRGPSRVEDPFQEVSPQSDVIQSGCFTTIELSGRRSPAELGLHSENSSFRGRRRSG